MLLHARQLSKKYGALTALDRLDLGVRPGEIVGILGPNGSGKSTAIRLFLGFLKPTSGQSSIANHDCWSDSINARRQVSYLPGELRLYENMTGIQLIHFLSDLRKHPEFTARMNELARQFDIDIHIPLSQMSSGMKRKVALMQVLLPETPLVILDEPTNTLDPTMRDQLLHQLAAAKQRGQAVVFSSHVLTEVEQVCDRVAILQKGKLVHWQNMAELRVVRQVSARFVRPAAEIVPPDRAESVTANSDTLDFEYAGPLPDLLRWLADANAVDVKIEPKGLSKIYQRFHRLGE